MTSGTSVGADVRPLVDVVAEARRVLAAADVAGVRARVFGGVAVAFHEHTPLPEALRRPYADIDLIVERRSETNLGRVLAAQGYQAERKFNALFGHKRQLFLDTTNGRQLDVFVGTFSMCHKLPLEGRLSDASGTLSPADLLLTKLQVVELNHKDVVDALALLDEHRIGLEADGDCIGLDRIVAITANEWGWHTTALDTLSQLESRSDMLEAGARTAVRSRIDAIRTGMAEAPKSPRWRLRSRLGRRIPWYELPEEHVR